MYQINAYSDGTTVATVRFDPYKVDMKKPNMDGLRSALQSIPEREQLQGYGEPDDNPDSTSLESWDEPDREYLEGQLAQAVSPGFAVVEVEDADSRD